MLQDFANYYWAHPIAVSAIVIGVILVLIWMTGSGSRRRFVTLNRTKETEQISRDLSRIASSLERIAKSYEMPPDFVGRPLPQSYEGSASQSHTEPPVAADSTEASAAASSANPLGGTASLLGDKKKLDLPNPLYRPK